MQSIRHYILTILLATIGGHTPIVAQEHIESMDLDALYQQIDEAISHSAKYVAAREQQIGQVRRSFLTESDPEKRLEQAGQLFSLFKPYKNDSALHYAEVCINLADTLHRQDLTGLYRARLARLCSNADLYVEALEQLRMINKSALDNKGLTAYYEAWMHVCGQIGSLSQRSHVRQRYYDMQDLYRDSVLMVAEKGSEEYLHLKMDILCARQQFQEALRVSDNWLNTVSDGTHENAFAAFYRSVVYDRLNNQKMLRYWLGKSALDDIKCAVMDQASLIMLAEHLSKDGDYDRAYRYVCAGRKFNLTYCPTLRQYQFNSTLNVIEGNYQESLTQKQRLAIYAIAVTVLLLIAVSAILFLLRRHPKK